MKPLELNYINGDGKIQVPYVRDVCFADESQLDLEIVLEDIANRPEKITNDKEADIYTQKLGKIREVERAISQALTNAKEPISRLLSLISKCGYDTLDKLADEATDIKNDLGRYQTLNKIGASNIASATLDKAKNEEQKAQNAPFKKERAAAAKRAKDLFKQAEQEAKKPTMHGLAQIEKWVGTMVDPQLYFKKVGAKHAEFVSLSLNSNAINSHCKQIIKNGGTITKDTIPGIALHKESYTQFRG